VTVAATFEIIKQLAGIGLDVHISVDPTAIGYQTDVELCSQNAIAIATVLANASHGRPGVHCLMLDMEDESLVDYTIELHDRLREMSLPVALTMQAYLHRTPTDLQRQIKSGSRVRLVKGAFAPASKIALTSRRALSERYRQLATQMLQGTSADPPFYPIFGTHDGDIQNYIVRVAAEYGVPKQNFEFEMLMGVKPELAGSLAADGYTVRLYVACGPDWWGYVNRRIGESPRNAVLLLKAICAPGTKGQQQ
jgi:proline dehydrogenase